MATSIVKRHTGQFVERRSPTLSVPFMDLVAVRGIARNVLYIAYLHSQRVLQPLADVYREWELKADDHRFCHVQSQLKIEKIRKVQAFVLLLLLKGSSVLLLARTGWGKSLIFQGLRYTALKESARYITVIGDGQRRRKKGSGALKILKISIIKKSFSF